jgi:hypothetical protein
MPDPPGAVLEHLSDLSRDELEQISAGNAHALLGDAAG